MALDNNDIAKLIEAQKEVFATKEDLAALQDRMREHISGIQNSVDAYMKQGEDYKEEFLALSSKVDMNEKRIRQLADKFDVELDS